MTMKTKLTLTIATLAALVIFGSCSSTGPNYDNPIVAALETKKHKEERLAKEKVKAEKRAREAEKRRAEYKERKKREEKAKNEKLSGALRNVEIKKWRDNLSLAPELANKFAKSFALKTFPSLNTEATKRQSAYYAERYKWHMLAVFAASLNQDQRAENQYFAAANSMKHLVTDIQHQSAFNSWRDRCVARINENIRNGTVINNESWREYCDFLIKNDLLPKLP